MAVEALAVDVSPSREQLLDMYERMVQIRVFEDLAGKNFAAGLIPGFVHLYAGEEAVAVGICSQLTDRDVITSTHRGHGHCIAKGVDIPGMVAELMGKSTGVCKGKGGSMHIADVERGMLGANGIVGGGMPLACGAALSAKTLGTGGLAVSFFGDGASNQGTFHESMNLAAIWKLPVVFVCENNKYGMGTSAERARRGEGPTLIEAKTYRYYGHFQGDQVTYRTDEELQAHKERDAIAHVRTQLIEQGIASAEELDAIDARVAKQLDDAWEVGKAAPFPEPEETLTDVYVSY